MKSGNVRSGAVGFCPEGMGGSASADRPRRHAHTAAMRVTTPDRRRPRYRRAGESWRGQAESAFTSASRPDTRRVCRRLTTLSAPTSSALPPSSPAPPRASAARARSCLPRRGRGSRSPIVTVTPRARSRRRSARRPSVNSAGIGACTVFWESEPDEFEYVLRVNLIGTFLAARSFTRRLLALGRHGAIVNIASTNAVHPGHGSVRVLRVEGRSPHVHACRGAGAGCAGHPRERDRPWLDDYRPHLDGVHPTPDGAGLAAPHPDGALRPARGHCQAVLYLASPLSQWVTGHLLVVDGGQSLRGLPLYLENLVAPSEIAGLVLRVERQDDGRERHLGRQRAERAREPLGRREQADAVSRLDAELL